MLRLKVKDKPHISWATLNPNYCCELTHHTLSFLLSALNPNCRATPDSCVALMLWYLPQMKQLWRQPFTHCLYTVVLMFLPGKLKLGSLFMNSSTSLFCWLFIVRWCFSSQTLSSPLIDTYRGANKLPTITWEKLMWLMETFLLISTIHANLLKSSLLAIDNTVPDKWLYMSF